MGCGLWWFVLKIAGARDSYEFFLYLLHQQSSERTSAGAGPVLMVREYY
jgi:hypothetical protein